MASVVTSISIKGPVGPIFDLATSARFWPQWHPASRAVGGVTQRPYQLGDVIHEQVQALGKDYRLSWKVVEHVRPERIVLQSMTYKSRISYTFTPRGEAVEFRRQAEYDEAELRPIIPDLEALGRQMHEQSEEALRRLKDLVEEILRAEAAGP
jgi:hypothetical protein